MISPSVMPSSASPLVSPVPKLKLRNFHDALHLGDSMRIIALHEGGYMAQLNGGVEVLLVQGVEPSPSDNTSPPPSSRSLPPHSSRRSSSLPSPSRSLSHHTVSRSLDGLDLGELRLSPRTSSSTSLPITTLYPRNKPNKKHMNTRVEDTPGSPRSIPTSPRASSPSSSQTLSPPIAPIPRSPPRQRRIGVKPLAVQRSPSYNYYPVQGWVLWRRTIGQWERVWMASKKSPTRICFYTSENEDSEEREAIKIEDMRSLWAPEEESTKLKVSQSIHFRLFTDKKTIYLIVPTAEKMRYWIAGLRKLNPDMEIDVRNSMDPASPLSPRSMARFTDSCSLPDESYTTDDEMDGWD